MIAASLHDVGGIQLEPEEPPQGTSMHYKASSKDSEDHSYLIHAELQKSLGNEIFSASNLP